jgi:hypothetical protein
LIGQVIVWQMTEEERIAYIEKHPIRKTEKPKTAKYSSETIDYKKTNERKIEALKKKRGAKVDYKWRGEKANDARYNK